MARFSPNNAASAATSGMAERAQKWLASLEPRQREAALIAFDTSDRRAWHYIPRQRPGLPLKAMNPAQRQLVWQLMDVALSDRGLAKSRGVLELEGVLGELTGRPDFRDPENYALAIFGEPIAETPWSWRFEGHHLSLTFTIVPKLGVATTPSFFGSNPAIVPSGHAHTGSELLAREREFGFGLLHDLDPSLKNAAIVGGRSLGDIVAGPGRETSLARFEGVSLARLSETQRRMAMTLAETFVDHLRAETAARELANIRDAGIDKIHFAWAGSQELGSPHYFRLHGPTLLIEYDNTQNGANHVHTVWHDP
ncbi:MAG: DUF3500 domain-containing protein, partial [Pseudomonadota bacterium]